VVIEVAMFAIDPARTDEFENEFAEGLRLLGTAPGSGGARLLRSVEEAGRYQLLVTWDSVEAHVVHFRQSPLNTKFHELIDGFLIDAPVLSHFEDVTSSAEAGSAELPGPVEITPGSSEQGPWQSSIRR
jgi:heme-degrading monooxygenase HmoA